MDVSAPSRTTDLALTLEAEPSQDLLRLLLIEVEDRSSTGIAAALHRLIRSGVLSAGDRLPTVRAIAGELGVSLTTVSDAWRALAAVGAIQPRGRAGTFVRTASDPLQPTRFFGIGAAPGTADLDLSTGTPDPALLPPLRAALIRVTSRDGAWTSSYLEDPVIPELEAVLLTTWPFLPERMTVVDGALDALSRIVDQVVRLGDRVVMEDPGFPPLIDMLERVGAEIVPVPMDDSGLVPELLAMAMASDPVAVFLQPRAQNPTGTSMSIERCRELASILGSHEALIVEDDHSGDITTGPDVSLGVHLPLRTVHIRSYSKSHGPDLRIAAVGGSAATVDAMVARRTLGPGWTSRLLQSVLLELLTDSAAISAVTRARAVYAMRGLALRAGLAGHGVVSTTGDGINAWVRVGDEREALLNLAAQGIKVAPGTPFMIERNGSDYVRVTTGLLDEEDAHQLDHVITALAGAARASSTQRGI